MGLKKDFDFNSNLTNLEESITELEKQISARKPTIEELK
jgi:uncharacterized coiled-coil protein SlyX